MAGSACGRQRGRRRRRRHREFLINSSKQYEAEVERREAAEAAATEAGNQVQQASLFVTKIRYSATKDDIRSVTWATSWNDKDSKWQGVMQQATSTVDVSHAPPNPPPFACLMSSASSAFWPVCTWLGLRRYFEARVGEPGSVRVNVHQRDDPHSLVQGKKTSKGGCRC
jgi:hypothetical protein